MNNDFEHILEMGSEVHLSSGEKNQIKSALVVRMQEGRLQKLSNDMSWFVFFRRHAIASTFIAVLFLTGSTSALAEKTAPGDLLYSLKTGVNEQVLGLFATSPSARALFEISLAQRRLSEAEHIALSNNPQPEVRDQLIAQVDEHIRKAGEQEQATEDSEQTDTSVVKQNRENDGPQPTFAALKTFSLSEATSTASTSIDNVIEKIHKANARISELKSKNGTGRNRIQAEIELIGARKELFQKKDQENQKTAEDLSHVVNDQIEKVNDIEREETDFED